MGIHLGRASKRALAETWFEQVLLENLNDEFAIDAIIETAKDCEPGMDMGRLRTHLILCRQTFKTGHRPPPIPDF